MVNNGQFPASSALIWRDQPSVFAAFREFSAWLFARAQRSSHISLLKLAEFLLDFLIEVRGWDEQEAGPVIVADLNRTGGRRLPRRLQVFDHLLAPKAPLDPAIAHKRQRRHQA